MRRKNLVIEELNLEINNLSRKAQLYDSLRTDLEHKSHQLSERLCVCASLSPEEARRELLEMLEDDLKIEMANTIMRYEKDARKHAKQRANEIIAQATTKFAGNYVREKLHSRIDLEDEAEKAKIIGKDGRNIRAIQNILGVELIVEKSNAILISSFSIYRRAIAKKTIELLLEDGRIQPARIEQIYDKVKADFEDDIIQEGKRVFLDFNLAPANDELLRLLGKLNYRSSYGQNALSHTIEVAKLAGSIAMELGGDVKLARRAGLLHDIGKALTDDRVASHVDLGVEVCRRNKESEVVINSILAHHGHENPKTVEACAVCTADVLSAGRPGARQNSSASVLQRIRDIEEMVKSQHRSIVDSYALQSGREIRVIVRADMIDDNETHILSHKIAKKIRDSMQYFGGVKVNVVREFRSVVHV